jgi:Na+-transporting methylmalonyl-CoA/oxaloacetate decarboxylase gamma subunit
MGRNAQAAAEMITILGVALVIIVLFLALSANLLIGARIAQSQDDARNSVYALAEAADSVYAQGEGASKKVSITLPQGTVFGANSTYIGRPSNQPSASQNGINIKLNKTDIYASTRTSLIGSFPPSYGNYYMRVTSRGAYVEIYPYLVDVDRQAVSIAMAKSERRSASIMVTRVSGEGVTVAPSTNWGFDDVALSISPESPFLASSMGSEITLTITSGAASGIYNSQLTLLANGATSGTNETINIPLSISVAP